MEPLTAIAAYTQIVGLLADFVSSRGKADTLDIKEFLEWLTVEGHGQLKTAIEKNHLTTVSIKAALSEGAARMTAQLDEIERLLVAASLAHGPFAGIASSLTSNGALSPQQAQILTAYEQMGAGKALLLKQMAGTALFFLDGQGGYQPDEPRFFETDLDGLVDLGCLSITRNPKGEPVFHLTRAGHELAKQLLQQPTP